MQIVSGSEVGPTCNELCIAVNDPFILVESSVNIDNGTLALVEDTVDSVEDTVIPVEAFGYSIDVIDIVSVP